VNNTQYAQCQSDQARVLDYLKRDIRRATSVAIYQNGTLVTGNNNWGNTLQITIPDYYANSLQEEDTSAGRTANTPTYTGGVVSYGGTLTIQYYVTNGAVIHNESTSPTATARKITNSNGAFTVAFCLDPSGLYHCRVSYSNQMRSGNNRQLSRQVDILCGQHSTL
jgi:hypothetical protein